jgi:hypothetical protein
MREISPGLWHWTAHHQHINKAVSSYYLAAERVLLDPTLPPTGLSWFDQSRPAPEHLVLTNRHHDRDAWKFREAFGCEVHCIANGLHELDGRGPATPFDFGDELPGGIRVYEIGAICPDETALHIPAHRALACADGVVRWAGVDGLTFVPDQLMDDPAQTKTDLAAAYAALLERGLDFDLLLLAHGDPVTSGARSALAKFSASGPS